MLLLIIVFGIIIVFLVYFLKKDTKSYGGGVSTATYKPVEKSPKKQYSNPRGSMVGTYPLDEEENYSPPNLKFHYRPRNVIPPNPLLNYQYAYTEGRQPVMLEDPIIPPPIAGPLINSYSSYNSFSGPYPGKPLNVPVPQGSLKMTSEKWKYPFYQSSRPLEPYNYFKPYGPNQEEMQMSLGGGYADDPYYTRDTFKNIPLSRGDISKQNLPFRDNSPRRNSIPYALNYTGQGDIPFIGSVNSFAPFAEVNTPWEKTGLLTRITSGGSRDDNEIVALYRQPIAPINDVFKYMVQDKDGFMIPLNQTFLEDGDIIDHITGKSGRWKVHIYVNNKFIWV